MVVLPTVRVSTAPTIPPALPIACARIPNDPGSLGVSSRMTSWVPMEGLVAIAGRYGTAAHVSSPAPGKNVRSRPALARSLVDLSGRSTVDERLFGRHATGMTPVTAAAAGALGALAVIAACTGRALRAPALAAESAQIGRAHV